jgi:hypothetical protein
MKQILCSVGSQVGADLAGALGVQEEGDAGPITFYSPGDRLFSLASFSARFTVDEHGVVQPMYEFENDDLDRPVIVADIDGCCVFSEDRLPFLLGGDVDAWNKNHHLDRPIEQGVAIYRKFLEDDDYRFFFVTGRPERAREVTLHQLHKWISPRIQGTQLLMRPDHVTGDDLHDTELKPLLLKQRGISPEDIFVVFEDRNSVVSMWRSLGVVCYQTAFGDF